MSIEEKENQPELDDRAIHETKCTIYVGRVRIIIDPRLNTDVSGTAESHVNEYHRDSLATNTPPKPGVIGVRRASTYFILSSVILHYSLKSMILYCTWNIYRALQPTSTNHNASFGPTKNK